MVISLFLKVLSRNWSLISNFSDEDKNSLFESIDTTRTQSTINIPQNTLDQMLIGAFCRNFNELDDTKKQELLNLLKGVK